MYRVWLYIHSICGSLGNASRKGLQDLLLQLMLFGLES